ncbi:Ig-like domain-containing protein [Thalassospira sp. MA62]|nr:Ig-like domain-containing protein [Thalassospira sp. MA62]
MKRPYILVIIGVVLIIAAIVANYMLTKSADEETAPQATQAPVVSTPEPSVAAPGVSDPDVAQAPEVTAPSFDVVRIGPDGNAVIAGRAEPNSKIRIREGENVIGEATADERGEWVVLPETPLASGDRELSLESEDASGNVETAEDKVIVLIPEGEQPTAGGAQSGDAAAQSTENDGEAAEDAQNPIIALKVPAEGEGAATVMQGPAPHLSDDNENGDAAPMPRLSIDVVDYDEEGRVAMSGKADKGQTVHIYLDNNHVGTATTDDDGNWAVTIGQPIKPGNYTLRADQVDENDAVTARVELPFERAHPDQILEPGARYVVQPGNSLWRIARRAYGEGLKYWVIYDQNRGQIRDPDLIYPGQIFALPAEETSAQ